VPVANAESAIAKAVTLRKAAQKPEHGGGAPRMRKRSAQQDEPSHARETNPAVIGTGGKNSAQCMWCAAAVQVGK
jgi:hypothetical protein